MQPKLVLGHKYNLNIPHCYRDNETLIQIYFEIVCRTYFRSLV